MHRIYTDEKILYIQGHSIKLQKKRIKSLRLRLIPPRGEIRLSVPSWYSDKEAEKFVLSRIDWIEEQKKTILSVHPLSRQEYKDGENILFLGRRLTVKIEPAIRSSAPRLEGEDLLLMEKEGTEARRQFRVESWYREQMKLHADPMIEQWSRRMEVDPWEWRIKKMNTRWGTCNVKAHRIWLNLELITMKPEIMEYVIVHELAHLLERGHNKRFKSILDRYLPNWRALSRELKEGLLLSC